MQSDFISQGHIQSDEALEYFNNEDRIYLGSYSMRIDEITRPNFQEMNREWRENAEKEIQMFMETHNGMHLDETRTGFLEPGNYHVYIENFFKSDDNSRIVFLHENGNVYQSFFHFIHYLTGDKIASVMNTPLIGNINESLPLRLYVEKLQSDFAVNIEYQVT